MTDVSHPSSLNLEPNPFEQSFASNTQQGRAAAPGSDQANLAPGGPPGAIAANQAKHGVPFSQGATEADQKMSMPGIDKMVTPLPLIPGAPYPANALPAGLGVFGATSPAGWLQPRFGPITPGALNTPSLDAFGHATAPNGAGPNPMFPHIAPSHTPQVPGAPHEVNGVPRIDAFAQAPRGVLPLESPGINTLVNLNPPAHTPHLPGVASIPETPAVPNGGSGGAGPKPPGESAAANGLYMLSQNQRQGQSQPPAEKPRTASRSSVDKPAEAISPESRRLDPPPPSRPSVDSNGTSAGEETLTSTTPVNAGGHRDAGPQASRAPTKKRSTHEIGSSMSVGTPGDGPKGEPGAEDESGSKRRWTNSAASPPEGENEEKRKQFLERNRIAAIKCRARKKQWVDNLQQKADMYSRANDELRQRNDQMRSELDELRQFVIRYHDLRSLPQHVLQIVHGNRDAVGPVTAAASREYGPIQQQQQQQQQQQSQQSQQPQPQQQPPQHVLSGALSGGHGNPSPAMPPMAASVPPAMSAAGPQQLNPSMVPSPAAQHPVHTPRFPPPHTQPVQPHYVPPPRQPGAQLPQQAAIQAPPMQQIHHQ